MTQPFRSKPWWLRLVTPDCWVSILPYTYVPDGINPTTYPAIVAHEATHLTQQAATGRAWWLVKYLLVPSFRLSQEAQAIAVEVSLTVASHRASLIASYAIDLSGRWYWWSASSPQAATIAIKTAISNLYGGDLWA